jgi:hypothetical protein
MAGLQTIVNKSSGLEINRRKVVGLQVTRNEIPRVTVTPTTQPWKMTLDMPSSLRYYDNRDLLEALDTLDRVQPEVISFGSNSCISWIFRYQGEMTGGAISGIRVQNFIGNQLVLNTLPVVPANTILFKPNDLIQIGTYAYPFTSTTQILRGVANTVTITTNRPNILSGSVANQPITVGSSCQFNMFCPNMPTYKLIPGGYVRGQFGTLNNALIEFSDSFELYEYVATA